MKATRYDSGKRWIEQRHLNRGTRRGTDAAAGRLSGRLLRVCLSFSVGAALSLWGAFGAFGEPLGLSTIDGQTVTSRMGGFVVQVPQEYEVDRTGGSWELSRQLVAQMKSTDQVQVDFAASEVNEADKSYIVNMGLVMPADDGTGTSFNVETLKAELAQSGLDEAAAQSGRITLGTKEYEYLKVDYGKLMADSMRDYLNTAELSDLQKQTVQAYIVQMEKMLVNDFYIRQEGNQIYVLCQTYSADQSDRAAAFLSCLTPYSGIEGWEQTGETGWKYRLADGSFAANCWKQDELGLTYHLDNEGKIQYSAWIQDAGGWKYVDELGHMVTSVTKAVDGVEYTFGADGYMEEGSERPKEEFTLGTLEGNHYTNPWADLTLTFPEEAVVLKGDGSSRTYALVGGEHVDPDDPELSYRVTVDFTEADVELDRFMDVLRQYGSTEGYQVDSSENVELGGHTYRSCRTSTRFADGTSHHSDWYVRQIEDKFVILHFDYYEELKGQADQVYQSIGQ